MRIRRKLNTAVKLFIGVLLLLYTLFPIYWLVAMSSTVMLPTGGNGLRMEKCT